MAKILKSKGVQALIKWVDDFIFFRYPRRRKLDNSGYQFTYDASLIWSVADALGWPWAIKKFIDFSPTFKYIGFDWSISERTVQLPFEKKTKYLAKLQTWTERTKQSKDEVESIIGTETNNWNTHLTKAGTLNHVTLVVPQGRSRLIHLYKFRGGFKNTTNHLVQHKPSVQSDFHLSFLMTSAYSTNPKHKGPGW